MMVDCRERERERVFSFCYLQVVPREKKENTIADQVPRSITL